VAQHHREQPNDPLDAGRVSKDRSEISEIHLRLLPSLRAFGNGNAVRRNVKRSPKVAGTHAGSIASAWSASRAKRVPCSSYVQIQQPIVLVRLIDARFVG